MKASIQKAKQNELTQRIGNLDRTIEAAKATTENLIGQGEQWCEIVADLEKKRAALIEECGDGI